MRLHALAKLAPSRQSWRRWERQAVVGPIWREHRTEPEDVQKLFPSAVYYCGQTAPVQLRNSGGVKFADGHYVLASLVDTSGYSTGIKEKYQGYLIAEVPLKIDGKRLPAGAYGIGFVGGNKFVVTDLGGNDVLTAHWLRTTP